MGRRRRDTGPGASLHGILLVDKPLGPTSHDVVGWARRVLRCRRVGHCGTLDPAASGLLVLAVGVATRTVPLLSAADKTYRADIILGRRTTTADREGEVIDEVRVEPSVAPQAMVAARGLVGAHSLPPPAYSAVKVDGVRAYARARRGEAVELEPRPMRVFSVDNLETAVDAPGTLRVSLDLRVSKGTYIRSLAELLGERLGLPAYLGGLRRLACAELQSEDPRTLRPQARAEAEGRPDGKPWWRLDLAVGSAPAAASLIPIDEALGLPIVECAADDALLARLTQGQAVPAAAIGAGDRRPDELVSLVARAPDGALETLIVAAIRAGDGGPVVRPERVLRPDKVPRSA
ncbi:MAG: tRNA pseudouridine(55) synthase TruB [Nannocystaceae bacterium]